MLSLIGSWNVLFPVSPGTENWHWWAPSVSFFPVDKVGLLCHFAASSVRIHWNKLWLTNDERQLCLGNLSNWDTFLKPSGARPYLAEGALFAAERALCTWSAPTNRTNNTTSVPSRAPRTLQRGLCVQQSAPCLHDARRPPAPPPHSQVRVKHLITYTTSCWNNVTLEKYMKTKLRRKEIYKYLYNFYF